MTVGTLRKNTLWVMTEFAVATFIQFFIIRHIVHRLGAAQMGVWAVLMSAAQIAGFLDFGLTAGVSRYLARARFENDSGEIEKILAIITHITIPLYVVLSVVIYGATWVLLPHIIQADLVADARHVLRYSTISYFFLVLSIASGSCLTGLHLGYRKSQLVIAGLCLQGVLAWHWVDQYGLTGTATAQIANYIVVILGALVLLKTVVGIRLRGLLRFDAQRAKEVMRFGAGLQLPSIAWSLFEISIRFLMSRFGGAELMGRYEIAYRVSAQSRVLFFYIAQPLGPALVARHLEGRTIFLTFYRTIYARFSLLAILVGLAVILSSPLVSWFMLGTIEPQYMLFATLTAVGAAVHVWAMPAENAAVSQGRVRYNAIGTFSAVVIMLLAGIPIGLLFGGYGVACCVLAASLSAAIIPVVGNSRTLPLPMRPWFREALAGLPRFRWSR